MVWPDYPTVQDDSGRGLWFDLATHSAQDINSSYRVGRLKV